jgi:hypothetical protein
MTYVSHADAFRAQSEFPVEAKIKVGADIWNAETAGSRLYAEVLSKKPSTIGKALDLAAKIEPPFTPKATMGHLRWIYTAGELEVDGKSYVVQAKPKAKAEPKAAKVAKVEKPARKRVSTELLTAALRATKPEAASRQRSLVRTQKVKRAA